MLSSVATASSELLPEESSEDDLFLGLLGLMQFLENKEFRIHLQGGPGGLRQAFVDTDL